MRIKKLIDEDFVNYKKPCMVLAFPNCTFKCDHECGMSVCQNSALANSPTIEIDDSIVVERYMKNKLTSAICVQGLEPLDDMEMLEKTITTFRGKTDDDIVIYTGYRKEEDKSVLFTSWLFSQNISNIVMKFGRFIPNQKHVFDHVLGVELSSDNQMAEAIC